MSKYRYYRDLENEQEACEELVGTAWVEISRIPLSQVGAQGISEGYSQCRSARLDGFLGILRVLWLGASRRACTPHEALARCGGKVAI